MASPETNRLPSTAADPTVGLARFPPPVTPDGRYIVVRGRLWRRANPALETDVRNSLVAQLMGARRSVKQALKADDERALAAARALVDSAKTALGERGPVWWTDGDPDLNRHLARNTGYAAWFETVSDGDVTVDHVQ